MNAADNPKEHERMTKDTETDGGKAVAKAPESPASIEEQLDTILPGSHPLEGIEAVHEGGTDYSVISVRNGGTSYHWVELGMQPSCTCGDYRFNRDKQEREPCAHIVSAVLADFMESDQMAVRELVSVTGRAAEASQHAQEAAKAVDDVLAGMREASTESDGQGGSVNTQSDTGQAKQNGAKATGGPQDMPHTTDPVEAADKLQSSYDSVVEDMQVKVHNDMIWVQTGQETPDTLPGPGNVQVFEAFLQNADQMEFVHENHDLADKKPGQWWKNVIAPADVDSYISEVLE